MTTKTEKPEQEAAEAVGLPKVSQSEIDKAKKEGILEAAKEDAKASYKFATDGNLMGEVTGNTYPGHDDIMQYEPLLRTLGIDAFVEAIDEDGPVPEEKVYGLLALERNGQNRTDYVKAMMKRLGLKADELPGGGPGYTNDTTPISKL